MDNNVELIKGIEQDANKYLTTYAKTFAKEAEKRLKKEAGKAIWSFYRYYTPKYYDRTEDLLRNSFTGYYHENGHGGYYGGVHINADKMKPYKNDDAYTVAMHSWEEGYHGNPTGYDGHFDPIQTTPSPLEMLKKVRDKKSFQNNIHKYSAKAALSQKFEYFKF